MCVCVVKLENTWKWQADEAELCSLSQVWKNILVPWFIDCKNPKWAPGNFSTSLECILLKIYGLYIVKWRELKLDTVLVGICSSNWTESLTKWDRRSRGQQSRGNEYCSWPLGHCKLCLHKITFYLFYFMPVIHRSSPNLLGAISCIVHSNGLYLLTVAVQLPVA